MLMGVYKLCKSVWQHLPQVQVPFRAAGPRLAHLLQGHMRLHVLCRAPHRVHPPTALLLPQLGRQLPVQPGAPLLLLGLLLMHRRQQVLILALQAGHLQHRAVA